MLHIVTMAVIRIDDKLHKKIVKWLEENGNKYKLPSVSAFVNNAIYEKFKKMK